MSYGQVGLFDLSFAMSFLPEGLSLQSPFKMFDVAGVVFVAVAVSVAVAVAASGIKIRQQTSKNLSFSGFLCL